MEPNNQDSYDFIMNPDQKAKAGPSFGGPQKLLMILGLFTVVTVAIIVLFSVVFSGAGGNRDKLVSVSSHQIELTRVLNLGVSKIENQKLKQQFQTLSSALSSDTSELSAFMAGREYILTPLEKNAQKDITTDEALDEAEQKNDFDPAFEQAVTVAASGYLDSLQSALASASSASEKELLNTAINNIQTIAQ